MIQGIDMCYLTKYYPQQSTLNFHSNSLITETHQDNGLIGWLLEYHLNSK